MTTKKKKRIVQAISSVNYLGEFRVCKIFMRFVPKLRRLFTLYRRFSSPRKRSIARKVNELRLALSTLAATNSKNSFEEKRLLDNGNTKESRSLYQQPRLRAAFSRELNIIAYGKLGPHACTYMQDKDSASCNDK